MSSSTFSPTRFLLGTSKQQQQQQQEHKLRAWIDKVLLDLPAMEAQDYNYVWEKGSLGVIFAESADWRYPMVSRISSGNDAAKNVAMGDLLLFANHESADQFSFSDFFDMLMTMKKPVLLRFRSMSTKTSKANDNRAKKMITSKPLTDATKKVKNPSQEAPLPIRVPAVPTKVRSSSAASAREVESLKHRQDQKSFPTLNTPPSDGEPQEPSPSAGWKKYSMPSIKSLRNAASLSVSTDPTGTVNGGTANGAAASCTTSVSPRLTFRERFSEGLSSSSKILKSAPMRLRGKLGIANDTGKDTESPNDQQPKYSTYDVTWMEGSLGIIFSEDDDSVRPVVVRLSPLNEVNSKIAINDELVSANGVLCEKYEFGKFFDVLQQLPKPVVLTFLSKATPRTRSSSSSAVLEHSAAVPTSREESMMMENEDRAQTVHGETSSEADYTSDRSSSEGNQSDTFEDGEITSLERIAEASTTSSAGESERLSGRSTESERLSGRSTESDVVSEEGDSSTDDGERDVASPREAHSAQSVELNRESDQESDQESDRESDRESDHSHESGEYSDGDEERSVSDSEERRSSETGSEADSEESGSESEDEDEDLLHTSNQHDEVELQPPSEQEVGTRLQNIEKNIVQTAIILERSSFDRGSFQNDILMDPDDTTFDQDQDGITYDVVLDEHNPLRASLTRDEESGRLSVDSIEDEEDLMEFRENEKRNRVPTAGRILEEEDEEEHEQEQLLEKERENDEEERAEQGGQTDKEEMNDEEELEGEHISDDMNGKLEKEECSRERGGNGMISSEKKTQKQKQKQKCGSDSPPKKRVPVPVTSIQAGDEIESINNKSVRDMSKEESMRLLNSGNAVIRFRRRRNPNPALVLPSIPESTAQNVPVPDSFAPVPFLKGGKQRKTMNVRETPNSSTFLVKWKESCSIGITLREVHLAKGVFSMVEKVCKDKCCAPLRHVNVGDLLIELNGKDTSLIGIRKTKEFIRKPKVSALLKFRHGPMYSTQRVSAA